MGDSRIARVRRRHRRPLTAAAAAILIAGTYLSAPGRLSANADPTITSYSGRNLDSPRDIAAGADGAMWFTNGGGNRIGRVSMTGVITTYTSSSVNGPWDIARGADGNMWFTNAGGNTIGRITPAGVITSFRSATIQFPTDITAGPDGALWFINYAAGTIGRITVDGVVSAFAGASFEQAIATGPDGAVWFGIADGVARITSSGVVTAFHNPAISTPNAIAAGADGGIWFQTTGFGGSMWRITPSGALSRHQWDTGGYSFALGPDGAFWFGDYSTINRATTGGAVSSYADPSIVAAFDIALGPDGAMWFTNANGNSIGRITVPSSPSSPGAPVISAPSPFSVDATGPTGALVTYDVSATDDVDGAIAPTCMPPSGSTLGAGVQWVVCSASDQNGNTAAASFTVTVRGAGEQLGDLSARVRAVKGQKDLADKLLHAQREVLAGHAAAACHDLSDFTKTVRSRMGKTIPDATASVWLNDAARIAAVLAC